LSENGNKKIAMTSRKVTYDSIRSGPKQKQERSVSVKKDDKKQLKGNFKSVG
jgi:hypothetical protein